MQILTAEQTTRSWSRLALHDLFIFIRFFVARWLILLGAWNSILAPMFGAVNLSLLSAAVLVAGWIFGFILVGED